MPEKIRVLIVDDDVALQEVLARFLSSIGDLEIARASSLGGARKMMKTLHPQITLVDLGLPDGDGTNLIQISKDQSPINQVIVVTGSDDVINILDALQLGATDYLMKPLAMNSFISILTEAINRCRRWMALIESAAQRISMEDILNKDHEIVS